MEELRAYSKKICFALLVHNNREVVLDLLDNIRCYCPNSAVVLYNGGDDPQLCHELGFPVCPTSRKLEYGVTAIYLLETMRWLEDIEYDYDYLINLDSDALFAREGYEQFIVSQMENKDYMGVDTRIPEDDFYCLIQVRKEYDLWKPLFGTEPFYKSFNVGQVFSRHLVQLFLNNEQYGDLLDNLNKTSSFGIDEIAYVTMTERFGVKLHAYPKTTGDFIRYRPHFPLDETLGQLYRNTSCYLIHPVPRDMGDETRAFVRSALKQHIQYNAKAQTCFLDTYIGKMPFFIRRKKSAGNTIEWLSASREKGLSYWKSVETHDNKHIYGPFTFGSDNIEAFTAIETHYGNIELIGRVGDSLVHYWRDEESEEWFKSPVIADGVKGTPVMIESSHGNFEVVAPLKKGGLGHWWRNNHHSDLTWTGPAVFGHDSYNRVILVENNANQLTTIVKTNGGYRYFVRDDANSLEWLGSYI
ncbi:hypothetical protein [Paenibacillus nasutitermitis]|uniref:Uncharacterized protein n=1 Tax=Paenibacillus nasutitermitis TaxID=1652958 RepID=A0A916Z4A3_9BACL|nr:hypothetical protein [Paenibacillus nasutitermitis]GGD75520.1 hypothetical protein GCM10010911_36870 [Paenibacillus nasutitermitis]